MLRQSPSNVGAGDKNVLYAPVFQVVEHGRPELGALVFTGPHTRDIFPGIQVDTNSNAHRFLHDLPFATDMVVDGIQKDHGADGFQRPLLPVFGDGQNLVGDLADRAV